MYMIRVKTDGLDLRTFRTLVDACSLSNEEAKLAAKLGQIKVQGSSRLGVKVFRILAMAVENPLDHMEFRRTPIKWSRA